MQKSAKIMVLGAGGQLGKTFVDKLQKLEYNFIAPQESESDITQQQKIASLINEEQPDTIINCAAYNAVDVAEKNSKLAYLVNSEAIGNLAAVCFEKNIKLVHYSSDYIFDGTKDGFYSEEDPPNPLNVYGKSKLEGEMQLRQNTRNYLLFRLSWVIGPGEQNFLFKMSQWAEKNPVLKISADEVSIPTFTFDIVEFTLKALDKNLIGLYHLTSSGYASRYELARFYAEQTGIDKLIIPVALSHFNMPASRPMFSCLSNEKLTRDLGVKLPHWKESLKKYVQEVQSAK